MQSAYTLLYIAYAIYNKYRWLFLVSCYVQACRQPPPSTRIFEFLATTLTMIYTRFWTFCKNSKWFKKKGGGME